MNKIVIDLDIFETIKDFHLWLKEVCQFPDYYGCNLDALADCLSDNRDLVLEVLPSAKYKEYRDLLVRVIEGE